MESIELIRENLRRSRDRVLMRVDDMRAHATVFPTPNGGGHTLWVLGHLAYVESLIVHTFLRGEPNPLAALDVSISVPWPRRGRTLGERQRAAQ